MSELPVDFPKWVIGMPATSSISVQGFSLYYLTPSLYQVKRTTGGQWVFSLHSRLSQPLRADSKSRSAKGFRLAQLLGMPFYDRSLHHQPVDPMLSKAIRSEEDFRAAYRFRSGVCEALERVKALPLEQLTNNPVLLTAAACGLKVIDL